MRRLRGIRRLKQDESGATIIEFAIVSIPLFLLIIGTIEYGLIAYTRIAVDAALTQAGRTATIGGGGCDPVGFVVAQVTQRIQALPNNAQAHVSTAVVSDPGVSPTRARDVCLVDAADPYPATCLNPDGKDGPYQENTGNATYDAPAGGNVASKAGDLTEIRVNYPWRILTPFIGAFFQPNGVFMINDTVVVKNEPFDDPTCP